MGEIGNNLRKIFSEKRNKHFEDKNEFVSIIEEVINNDRVQLMKRYNHHGNTTCFRHCLHVSYYNFKICKALGLDYVSAAKAGMIHDLFLYDWHTHTRKTGDHFHGMTHPKRAYLNARKEFVLNQKEKDIIEKHMWPLTFSLPRHKETSVIVFTDKFCGLCEVFDGYFKK